MKFMYLRQLLLPLCIFAICLFNESLYAQISTGEPLPQTMDFQPNSEIEYVEYAAIEMDAEQKNKSSTKGEAWKFGEVIPVNLNLKNSGEWEKVNDQDSRWTLHIKAKEALSINLNFSEFYLSSNAKLFIYNKHKEDILGAITKANNKKDGFFSTHPLMGEEIHLELWLPTLEIEQNRLHINQLVYGYKDIREKVNKAFNGSRNCNQNINCPEGIQWENIKRSVVMITTFNNTRLCTGTLVNNTAQDSTPYILTASHCNVAGNSNFIFNYESPNPMCNFTRDTSNGALNQSISGATSRARGISPNPSLDFSDFHLFELSSTPPANYNVYYAGWSAKDTVTARPTTIHHPSGDVKKISLDEDTTLSTGYNTLSANTHWMVADWETGTTEGGSSGSALFDENLRVIGQLHGGDAACNNNAQDYYGKFAVSWDSLSANNRQLKHWLDPNNTGIEVMDGMDPNGASMQRDIQLLPIRGVNRYACDTAFTPVFAIRNNGSDTLTTVDIRLLLDGVVLDSVSWSGSLPTNQIDTVKGPVYKTGDGFHTLSAIAKFNGGTIDQNNFNNEWTTDFFLAQQTKPLNFRIKTDDFGLETSWELVMDDTNKVVLYKGGPYNEVSGGETITRKMCVPDSSCFNLILYDAFNDGFNGSFGNGNVLITDLAGDTLVFENNFTGSNKTLNFCSTNAVTLLSESKVKKATIKMFPNPINAGGLLQFEGMDKMASCQLFDMNGRLILHHHGPTLRLPKSMTSGMYFVRLIYSDNSTETKKLLVR